ncbi:MAG: SAM-dependent methyltransferase [Pseudomonadota bacterium]
MTPLEDILRRQIALTGPISLSDYMAECLLHPDHGYYATRDPLGRAGDFITAPEVSQMFGEVVGLALAQAWIDQGRPADSILVELGPGRGTLMADALRATQRVPGFHDAINVHLIEASPVLRAAQADRVRDATWHDDFTTLPEGPTFAVANEFFDALPIRQFTRDPAGWREHMVGIENDVLTIGLSTPAPLAALDHRLQDTKPGDVVELCPALPGIVQTLGARINHSGGVGLIIDYGDWRSLGDTLQALAAHDRADPFRAPGTVDLTAHVDFEAVAEAARPAAYTRLVTQGVFLERLGITQRAQTLARSLSGSALDQHVAAHRRLTHPTEMGEIFKVMGLYPAQAAPPPGLTA